MGRIVALEAICDGTGVDGVVTGDDEYGPLTSKTQRRFVPERICAAVVKLSESQSVQDAVCFARDWGSL